MVRGVVCLFAVVAMIVVVGPLVSCQEAAVPPAVAQGDWPASSTSDAARQAEAPSVATAGVQEKVVDPARRLLERLLDRVAAAESADLRVRVELHDASADGEPAVWAARVQLLKEPPILRLQIEAPEVMEGQILVIEQKARRLSSYIPVLEQVQVMELPPGEGEGFESQLEELVMIPRSEKIKVADVTGELGAGEGLKVLEIRGEDITIESDFLSGMFGEIEPPARQLLWIDPEELVVRRIQLFSATGELLVAMKMEDVVLDCGLGAVELSSFPPGAEIVHVEQ